jgi:hypothetical protein
MNLLIYSKNWNTVRNFMVGTAFAVAASGQALAQTAVSIEPPATDSSSTSPTFAPIAAGVDSVCLGDAYQLG